MDRTSLTRWILCLLFLAVLGGGSAGDTKDSAAVQSLGRIVYLPNLSSQDDHVSAPFIFDAENLLDLAKKEEIGRTDQHSKYFDNSDQLVQQLACERGIDGSLREERFSVQAEFKRLVGSERDVNAAEVHAMRFRCKTYIQKDHRLNEFPLKSDFKNDLNRLPVTVKNEHPFRDFMRKWGSHIVETAYTGAAYQSWSSARRSNNYRQPQLEARACLKAEGRTGHALQEPCQRYNEHDRDEASRLNAFDTKRVRGGTRETRRRLERDLVTKELIEKFLREDDVDEQPVRFEYMPVWDFLLERCARDSDDAKRALALKAYYEGQFRSAGDARDSAAVQSLGRIVYLPNLSSQDDHVSAPFIFDAENLLDLAKKEEIGRTDQHSKYFDNSDQLVRRLAKESGIDGSLREERFSVQAEFKRLAGSERDVNAAEVHAMRFHSKTYIQKDHRLNEFPLKSDFKNDLNRLPVTVKNAHEDRAWQPFRDFMNKWGSHIVETAYTGAAYQSWSSARRSNNYRQPQLEARACLKAEGRTGHALQEPCQRYNEHDRDEASRLNAFDTKRVRGGTRETRRRLERDLVTKELIEKFLREDDVDEQPVRFEYMPVWDFLLERCARDSDDAKRALALKAYYEGQFRSAGDARDSAAVQSLGRIVYLPNLSSQDDHVSAPFIFDAENLLDLAKKEEIGRTDQHSKYFDNSDQLVRRLAKESGIDGSLREERFSVQAEFKRLAGSERDVNAAEVHAMRFHSKTYIQKDHRLNEFPLKSDFKNDLNRLPVTVKNAHEDRAWQPFRDFMNKWGSHIVETAYTGAAYQSWSSARRSNNYRQPQLEARACLKAEGRTGHALQEPCQRYNEHDRDEASRLNAFDTKRVRGGTRETRRRLQRDLVTKELIEKFLREDDVDEQSVHFEYMPVWDFLLERCARDSDDAKRALGLQAYYQGWAAHGCPLVTTNGQQNNNAQMMVPEYTQEKKPTGRYLCIRRCQGCHDYNNDCHFEVGQACCRAYGPSALRRVEEDFVVRAPDYNSGWCDADNGCKYSMGSGCHCEKSNEEEGCNYRFPLNPNDESLKYKVIWDQRRPRDFESLLAMEK